MSDTEIEFATGDDASPDLSDRFEAGDDDRIELEYGSNDPNDGKRVIDAAEYERIISGSAQADRLTETVQSLGHTQAQITSLLQANEERSRAANAPRPPEDLDEEKLAAELEEDILANGKAGKSVLKTAKAIAKQMVAKEAARFEQAMGHLQNQFAQMQVSSVTSDPGAKWVMENHSNEVNQILAGMPPDQKLNKAMVQNAVNYVKGLHADEYIEAQLSARNGGKASPAAKAATVARSSSTFAAKGGASPSSSGSTLRIPVTEDQLRQDAENDFWTGDLKQYARLKYGKRS